MWSAPDAAGLAPDGTFEAGSRLDAEAGYGLAAFGGRGRMTPFAGLALSETGGRELRAGARWTLGPDLHLRLEGTRHEPADDEAPEHAIRLRAAFNW